MIFDTHMHCDYSCDSEMKFADAIGAAAEQGIGITITEHWIMIIRLIRKHLSSI